MANQSKLKAYVRYDGTGRVIAGGPILQRFKPKVGNWVEIDASECCNYVPTTTTTTTATPTTTTTTTTATPLPILYIGVLAEDACAGTGPTLTTYTYSGGTTLCDCTSLDSAGAASLSAGGYYVSDGVNTRPFLSTGGGSTLLTEDGPCNPC